MKRDENLDLLRILSCIGVIGLHSFQRNMSIGNLLCYRICGFSIPVFFAASGYILLGRQEDFSYSIRRIRRILLLVLYWNVLYWLATVIRNIIQSKQISFLTLVKSILNGFLQKGRFWHFWYLGALIIVYALLPLVQWVVRFYFKNNPLFLWNILLIGCVSIQFLSEFVFRTSLQRRIIQPFRVWTWLQYFLLGGVLSFYKVKWRKQTKIYVTLIPLVCMTIIIERYQDLISVNYLHSIYGESFYDSITMIFWIISIFFFVMNLKLGQGVKRMISVLVSCTMGIYLIHPILIRYLIRIITPNSFGRSVCFFVIVLVGSFVITDFMRRIPLVKRLVVL